MDLHPSQLQFFADYIFKELGIVYNQDNFFQLEKRLAELSKSLGFIDEVALYEQCQRGISGITRQLLLDIATNNETSFFRDPKVFQAIEKHVIPALQQNNPGMKVIRIWSAACSYGQEPYSLAILLNELAAKIPNPPRFEIVATDVSETALKRAADGKYSHLEVQRGLSASHLVKNFTKDPEDYWTVKPDLRICVQFKQVNLLSPSPYLGEFDLILCRNMLIYQKEAGKRAIIDQIRSHLSKNGFLILGAAESLLGISDQFEQIAQDGSVFFKKRAA